MVNSINVKLTAAGKNNRHGYSAYNMQPINIKGLRELLLAEMKDIYWAEKALNKALPRIIRSTATHELFEDLSNQLKLVRKNIAHLQIIITSMGEVVTPYKSSPVIEIIHEISGILKETDSGKIRDVRLIGEIRKIELHKITAYGVLCYFAKRLGEEDIMLQLEGVLKKEKSADLMFSDLAQSFINTAEAAGSD